MNIKKDLLNKTKEYADYAKDHANTYAKDYERHGRRFERHARRAARVAERDLHGRHSGSVALALIGGLVLGAVLGVLFAPEAGTETRTNLGTSLQDLGTTVSDKAQQGKEAITNLADKAVDAVKSKIGSEGAQGADTDIDHPSFS